MPKKLLFIGGPILLVILLVAVTFIFDIFGVKSGLFGSEQDGSQAVDLGTVAQAQQRSLNQYDKFLQETIKLERETLKEEREQLETRLRLFDEQTKALKKSAEVQAAKDAKLSDRASQLVDQEKALSDQRRVLEAREIKVKDLELQQEENRPVPLPVISFTQEAKDREHKKMARGFSTMRAKEVANILNEMLKRGDEGRADVLSLLRKTDGSTRMRILSVIAKDDIKMATQLTQTLMLPAGN